MPHHGRFPARLISPIRLFGTRIDNVTSARKQDAFGGVGGGDRRRLTNEDGRSKCHDALSIGDGGDDAVFLLEFLAEITGSSSLVGGLCWMNGIRGSSICSFSQRSMAAS